jgi:hypothetical protein
MSAGYSGTPLARKLGIKEGHLVAAVGAPEHFASLVAPLPHGVRLRRDLRGGAPHDVLIVFVTSDRELRDRFERARAKLDPDGGLWVAWPKQSSPLARGLKESHVRAYGLSTGLVDNKICAVDEDWSGLRFVVRTADRPPRARRRS